MTEPRLTPEAQAALDAMRAPGTPAVHPQCAAWDAYRQTAEFSRLRGIAMSHGDLKDFDGALWGIFEAGYERGRAAAH